MVVQLTISWLASVAEEGEIEEEEEEEEERKKKVAHGERVRHCKVIPWEVRGFSRSSWPYDLLTLVAFDFSMNARVFATDAAHSYENVNVITYYTGTSTSEVNFEII